MIAEGALTNDRHAELLANDWQHYPSPGADLYISPIDGEVYTIELAWHIHSMGVVE